MTDLSQYYKNRYNTPEGIILINENEKNFLFSFREGGEHKFYEDASLKYELSFDFRVIDPVLTDRFIAVRDKLIEEKKLSGPLTGTDAYKSVLMNSILKWNGKKFISFFTK